MAGHPSHLSALLRTVVLQTVQMHQPIDNRDVMGHTSTRAYLLYTQRKMPTQTYIQEKQHDHSSLAKVRQIAYTSALFLAVAGCQSGHALTLPFQYLLTYHAK